MQVPHFLPRGHHLVYAKHCSLLALMRNASATNDEIEKYEVSGC